MIITQDVYDGTLIHDRFAYRFFRKSVSPAGNIVAFRAPMDVTTALIDLEDSLESDFIKSEDAINFCWEIPNLCPFGAVAFQRWFNANIGLMLAKIGGFNILIDGDDIMIRDKFIDRDGVERDQGKVSVSITYSQNNVALGHTGINIKAGKEAPPFAFSSSLNDAQIAEFVTHSIGVFNNEVKDIWTATSKVIV